MPWCRPPSITTGRSNATLRLAYSAGTCEHFPCMNLRTLACLFLSIPFALSAGETPAAGTPPDAPANKPRAVGKLSPQLQAALEKLVMPGVKINVAEWSVDVDARVCLREGTLELIACTKDTKEHESIIVVDAKPSHIHTALLLLHAKAGNPAMQKSLDKEGTRFVTLPPRGGPVDVFLVIRDANGKDTEYPISDFINAAEQLDEPAKEGKPANFPTHTFLFAGSILDKDEEGKRTYLADVSGSVISIATFGDELLCLPDIHDASDSLRMWQINGEKLPALDSKVILRLRPQVKPQDEAPEGQ